MEGIRYQPTFRLPKLETFEDLEDGIKRRAFFNYSHEGQNFAVSWWVSPKRTRSYPYARVYNTLQSQKRVTIIPIVKDEGKGGDRDFLQWDTVSLMTLLQVYVVVAYYERATLSHRIKDKITSQEFDYEYLRKKFKELSSYQSDAYHWNLEQLSPSNIKEIGRKAVESYERISKELNVEMHDLKSAMRRIEEISRSADEFKNNSRKRSMEAQSRELRTIQPKESVKGEKASIDIQNYLGGLYHFTLDEAYMNRDVVCMVEAKNSAGRPLPSEDDIKDGLMKMIVYSNLKKLFYLEKESKFQIARIRPILKLTGGGNLCDKDYEILEDLLHEAKTNNFEVLYQERIVKKDENKELRYMDFVC